MGAFDKKRICNELLHIALVISLLRSGTNNRYFHQVPVISTNFFNDVTVANDIVGPSWAYSRTSFHHHLHHSYHDPMPYHEMKTLDSNYMSGTGRLSDDLEADFIEDLDVDLNIINQLRILTLNRFNSLPRLGKDLPAFQDITAFLLSESTSPTNTASTPTSVPDAIEYVSPTVPPAQQNHQQMVTVGDLTSLSEETLPMSPGEDSGHEETIDEVDAQSLAPETVKDFPPEVSTNNIVLAQRNSERRESYGFHSDSDEELLAMDILVNEAIENENCNGTTNILSEPTSEVKTEPVEETEPEGIANIGTPEDIQSPLKEESEDTSALEWVPWVSECTSIDIGDLSPTDDTIFDSLSLELLEHVQLNEVEGAAGIDVVQPEPQVPVAGPSSPDMPSSWEEDYELLLEAERSSLEFYKKFNDISEIELNNAIAPQDLHVFDEDLSRVEENANTSSGSRQNVKIESDAEMDREIKKEESEPTLVSTCLSQENEDEDVFTHMLDDFLEGDSGVFDFFGTSSPERADVTQEDEASNSSQDSILRESSEGIDSTVLNEDTDAEEIEADESNFSADMIQTAPIHAGARPTSHAAQPRGFQVHSRMPGLLRGSSMEQRWQDLANLLTLQSSTSHDPSGAAAAAAAAAGIHQPIPHHFAPHHPYHHHPHTPSPLHSHHHHHPHSMHPPHFGSAVPPTAPYSTDTARSVLLQNATLPPPELNATGPYVNVGMGASSNLGSAVASSMHLTNSSEPMIDPSSHYKMMDPTHDMLYYQNSTTEMGNQTSATGDGFNLSSILNDDELQLMDMAMNEGHFYTMRGLDNGVSSTGHLIGVSGVHPSNGVAPTVSTSASAGCSVLGATAGTSTEDRMEASSDSAVSSMGSERAPPMTDPQMSDNEWVEADGHPHGGGPHDLSPYSMDYSRGGKLGYGDYFKDRVPGGGPVAQKKHHMFGKRFQQEQSGSSHPYSIGSHLSPYPPAHHHPNSQGAPSTLDLDKFGCPPGDYSRYNGQRHSASGPIDPTMTNHTYSLPPTHPENPILKAMKPQPPKEKQQKMIKYFKTEDPLTRDEKKARSMNIPITTDDIINLPMDEFNERLSKYDLSESQLSLIRDIRRRGKNKVAAQNCRKRKLDQIIQLADEVQRIREKKTDLHRQQESLMERRSDLKERYSMLYRTVFQALRDSEGNPYSPYEFSLHHSNDGSVVLLPRNATQVPTTSTSAASTSSGAENGMNHQSSSSHHGATRRDKPKDENKKE